MFFDSLTSVTNANSNNNFSSSLLKFQTPSHEFDIMNHVIYDNLYDQFGIGDTVVKTASDQNVRVIGKVQSDIY